MRFFPTANIMGKLNTVIKNVHDRTCGIAPDGTRMAKAQPVQGMPPRGTSIPGSKDHSPRYGMSAPPLFNLSPPSEYVWFICFGVLVRRSLARPMINPSSRLITRSWWTPWPLPRLPNSLAPAPCADMACFASFPRLYKLPYHYRTMIVIPVLVE